MAGNAVLCLRDDIDRGEDSAVVNYCNNFPEDPSPVACRASGAEHLEQSQRPDLSRHHLQQQLSYMKDK